MPERDNTSACCFVVPSVYTTWSADHCLMGDAGSRSVLEINGVRTGPSFVIKYLLCVSNQSGPGICPGGRMGNGMTDGSSTSHNATSYIYWNRQLEYLLGKVNFILIRGKVIWLICNSENCRLLYPYTELGSIKILRLSKKHTLLLNRKSRCNC